MKQRVRRAAVQMRENHKSKSLLLLSQTGLGLVGADTDASPWSDSTERGASRGLLRHWQFVFVSVGSSYHICVNNISQQLCVSQIFAQEHALAEKGERFVSVLHERGGSPGDGTGTVGALGPSTAWAGTDGPVLS